MFGGSLVYPPPLDCIYDSFSNYTGAALDSFRCIPGGVAAEILNDIYRDIKWKKKICKK